MPPLLNFSGGKKLNEELETLCDVQKIDTRIIENEKKRAGGPQRIEEMTKEILSTREKLVREKAVIEELEKERRKNELELETEKAQVKKAETKLNEVKTNKEYQAILKEIEVAKTNNEKTEEEVLLLLDRVEELRKDLDSASKNLQKREKEVDEETKRLQKEISTIDAIVSDLKKDRERLLSGIEEGLKARYNTLIERRGGVAVVEAKNGTCMGCFMNIPPQLFIEVMKNSRIITCPSCNRIFFYAEED
jgi:uncharacterized protein